MVTMCSCRRESQYDPVRAHANVWRGVLPLPTVLPPPLSSAERSQLKFPALAWLDEELARIPSPNLKVLAIMPVNVAAQPMPGTHGADVEAECKARIVAIARKRGATLIDWRIASSLTTNDLNYWDSLHYRVPIATQIAKELASAALSGQEAADSTYQLLVRRGN